MMKIKDAIVERLKQGPATAAELSTLVYGNAERFNLTAVYAHISYLRRNGVPIRSRYLANRVGGINICYCLDPLANLAQESSNAKDSDPWSVRPLCADDA